MYGEWFKAAEFPVDLFALAVGADVGGRLGTAGEGERAAERARQDLRWLRERCASVDAGALWRECAGDRARFKAALQEARARALRRSRGDA
jgi:hypothetical protein